MKIKFLKEAKYRTCRRDEQGRPIHPPKMLSYVEVVYKAGQVVDLPDDQAHRWLRREAAEEVKETRREAKTDAKG